MTEVVNIHHEDYDIYIGRAGKGRDGYFGNPYRLIFEQNRGSTLTKYKEYFLKRIEEDSEFKQRVLNLKGLKLGCFCKPRNGFEGQLLCHGQIIAQWVDSQ